MTNLKDDLVYKGVSITFSLPVTLKEGEECHLSVNREKSSLRRNVIHFFLKDLSEAFSTQFSDDIFEPVKGPLQKMLDSVDCVQRDFQKTVDETCRSRESGRSVAWVLEPHLKRLIPQDLVGGRKNKENLLKNFRKSLLFGKEDKVHDSLLMDKLEIKTVVWLKSQKNCSVKHRMLGIVVKWLWQVAKRLVASCFYVSDTQGGLNQLTYIPKRIWKAETDRAFNLLSQLQPLTAAEAQQLAAVRSPAALRWMPKSEGLRPIISVRGDKKSIKTTTAKNVVLSLLKKYNCHVNVRRLHNVWKSLIEQHKQGKKQYFVACDIQDAFGSVNQDKMIEILEEEVNRQHGPVALKEIAKEIATIKNAVKCQTVKKIKRAYLLSKGLAQGMPLSSPLCNLYLAHLDQTTLCNFTRGPGDHLIRGVDDYLYITPDRAKAQQFLNQMNSGFNNYGIKINPSKTQTNLEVDKDILYHGYLLNTANLEVYIRYNQGINVSFRNSIVFKEAPISLLEKQLVNTPHVKLNHLTLDSHYMSIEGVACNVLHTGCLLARRFMAILALSHPCDVPESGQLVNLILRSTESVTKKVYKMGTSCRGLRMDEIKWVVLRAFLMILTRAAPMKKNLPYDVVTSVSEIEEVAKAAVRPQVARQLSRVISNIPPQFRNVDDD